MEIFLDVFDAEMKKRLGAVLLRVQSNAISMVLTIADRIRLRPENENKGGTQGRARPLIHCNALKTRRPFRRIKGIVHHKGFPAPERNQAQGTSRIILSTNRDNVPRSIPYHNVRFLRRRKQAHASKHTCQISLSSSSLHLCPRCIPDPLLC